MFVGILLKSKSKREHLFRRGEREERNCRTFNKESGDKLQNIQKERGEREKLQNIQ